MELRKGKVNHDIAKTAGAKFDSYHLSACFGAFDIRYPIADMRSSIDVPNLYKLDKSD